MNSFKQRSTGNRRVRHGCCVLLFSALVLIDASVPAGAAAVLVAPSPTPAAAVVATPAPTGSATPAPTAPGTAVPGAASTVPTETVTLTPTVTLSGTVPPTATAALPPGSASATATAAPVPGAAPGDVTTYLGSIARTSFNATETRITASSAANLVLSWSLDGHGSYISTQPIVANGVVYWGDYNGYEHATNATTGKDIWSRFLGDYYAGSSGNPTYCTPDQMGVVASPAVAQLNGRALVFVPGGGHMSGNTGPVFFFALDAASGQVVWQTLVGNAPADTMWSSPAIYNGSIYVGVAAQGGCPDHAASRLLKLNEATGALQATAHLVPAGCTGGDIWGSPAIDVTENTVYFATGDQDNKCLGKEPLAQAVVEVRASDLGYMGSWKVQEATDMDHDFGSTPTLFSSGTRGLVGVVNKNGVFYTFARDRLSSGPIWIKHIADPGLASPEIGDGSVSPASWDGQTLYVGGGTSVDKKCQGTVEALDPGSGKTKWSDCMPGPVIPAVVGAPGILVVGASSHLMVLSATTGAVLWKWLDPRMTPFWAAPTISNGVIYAANSGWAEPGRSWGPGRLYAFTLAKGPLPTPTPVPNVCPAGWSCTDIGNPTVASSDLLRSGTWTVISGGGDIWATGDQFHLDYKTVLGNAAIAAQVRTQSYSDPWAKAGVMLRAGTGPGQAFYDVLVTPSNGIVVQYRSTAGASAIQATTVNGAVPVFLKVSRTGSSFSAYTSADGAHWVVLQNSTVTINALNGPALAGLAVTAHNLIDAGTVTYRAVSVAADQFATATPTPIPPTRTPTPTAGKKTPAPVAHTGTPTPAARAKSPTRTPTPSPG